MENNKETNNSFNYTYSAKERAELKKIRERYIDGGAEKEISKLERLRILDASVGKKAARVALSLGVISSLIMGFGMSLVMSDLGKMFGSRASLAMPIGISVGLVGLVGVILAYPLYQKMLVRERKRVAPEILRLTEELLGREDK